MRGKWSVSWEKQVFSIKCEYERYNGKENVLKPGGESFPSGMSHH